MTDSSVSNSPLRLSTPLSDLPDLGPRRVQVYARLGLRTINDLLRYLPLRYELETAESNILNLTANTVGSTRGTIVATRLVQPKGRFNRANSRFEATLEDHSHRLNLVWFNSPFLRDRIHPGMNVLVKGKVVMYNAYPQMVNPHWQEIEQQDRPQNPGDRLRPIYPATESLPSSSIETLIQSILKPALTLVEAVDPIPSDMLDRLNMPTLAVAYRMIHAPTHLDEVKLATRRLSFNELLLLQLGICLKRHHVHTALSAPALRWSSALDQHIRERFPFALTAAQQKVVSEIASDLQRAVPMNRLLQGDVGSGKTVVALYAMLMAVADRKQAALMTPTELLAQQHHASISRMMEGSSVRIALLTGQLTSSQRTQLQRDIESGNIEIVIGTQALLTESVRFHELALVVVDEQHRFGVSQRAAFKERVHQPTPEGRQRSPHYLVMTATPIPRTLSLTVFGDLDVSVIDELPPGRGKIVTRVVPPTKTDEVYAWVMDKVKQGQQAYVVVPAIDESGQESAAQLRNVRQHVTLLQDKFGHDVQIAAVHGQLKPATRQAIMRKFHAGQVQVLVATTVIEVGVDVPNASLMVIEHAERFGLAQLHQLRGRIGRSAKIKQSVCVLIAQATTEEATKRLTAISSTTDGFKIAEADLEIRGMGDFFGTRQHGLPPLRIASIPRDLPLLMLAKREAESILHQDPGLHSQSWHALRKVLIQQHGQSLGLIDVG